MPQTLIATLEQQIEQTQDPLEKVRLLNELTLALEESDLVHAIRVMDESLQLAQSLDETLPGVPALLASSLFTRGLLSVDTTNYEVAISSIYQALPLITQQKDDLLNGRALEVLARANFYIGNAPEGFEFCWQALGFYENLSNPRWQSGLYNLVGRQYLEMGQLEWAERYFQLALKQLQGIDINKSFADIHLNLCLLDTLSGNFDQALRHANEAVTIYQKFNAMEKLTKALVILARVHEAKKDFEKALLVLEQALQITEEHHLLYRQVRVLLALGQIHVEHGDYDLAFLRLHKALELSEHLHMPREGYKIHRALARGYKLTGNFERSLDHFEYFYRLEKQNEEDQEVQRVRSLEIMHQMEQIHKDTRMFSQQSRLLREQVNQISRTRLSDSPTQITDPLTGLLNRKHFLTILENDHLNVEHYGKVVSMIMVDVDQFKKLNQEHGNLIADQILVEFGGMIQNEFRRQDLVWRISGQEFVILLPNTECKHAKILANRLIDHIRDYTFEVSNQRIQITVSMGIACTDTNDAKRVDILLEHASQAWSIAKQKGGNRLETWPSHHSREIL